MPRKTNAMKGQLDLFVTAKVHRFPLARQAALVRGIADRIRKRPTSRQKDWLLSYELNFHFTRVLAEGATKGEAADELEAFRNAILAAYYRGFLQPLDHGGAA